MIVSQGLSFSLLLPVGGCLEEQLLTRRAMEPRLAEKGNRNFSKGLLDCDVAFSAYDELVKKHSGLFIQLVQALNSGLVPNKRLQAATLTD